MASDYFDSSIEFPELDILTGLPVGTKPSAGSSDGSGFGSEDWQKQFLEDGAKALDSGVFVNPMDIATQEENKKLRKQLEDLRAESERAQAEFREQQDKYVEVLRQLNEKNQADLEEQRVQHERQMAELTSHFEALQTASRNAGEKESEMRSQLDQIRAEKELIQRQTEELKRELDDQRRLADDERRKAAEEKDRILAEAKEMTEKMAGESSAKEEEIRNAFQLEKQGLLDEIEGLKAKAAEDADSQRSYYENKIQEEIGLKDAEMAAKLAEADEDKRMIQEKADQDQAVLRERASNRINEIIAENQKLQDESAALAQSLEESNKNYEQLAAELNETRSKLEYSESEQAKREIEAARTRLAEEASSRDQKIEEAKEIIQKQWSKIQDDRALIEAEKEVLSKERADAEEEKRRAVSWQQSTLTERIRLQDAQKKLASDQEEMDALRSDLENLRAAMDEEKSRFAEEKEAYARQVADETAERQRQLTAARDFLEEQRRESEEERANVLMERLTFEKERDDASKQLQTDRDEFEGRKRRFFEELSKLVDWEGFKTDSFNKTEATGDNTDISAEEPSEEVTKEEVPLSEIQDVPEEETASLNDFFQDDPVENVFEDEQLPSQDRIIDESPEVDDKSVMASPFADLFNEPSLTESLFSSNQQVTEQEDNASVDVSEVAEETLEAVASDENEGEDTISEEVTAGEDNAGPAEEQEPDELAIAEQQDESVNETEEVTGVAEDTKEEESDIEFSFEPLSDEQFTVIDDLPFEENADIPTAIEEEKALPELNDEQDVETNEAETDDIASLEDLTSTLAFEIEQKVSELMDTVSQSEAKEPVLKEHTKENLFDTLAEVGIASENRLTDTNENDISFDLSPVETETKDNTEANDSFKYTPLIVPEVTEDEEQDDEAFDFDAVTDALNIAMLEKDDYTYTENNILPDGDSYLIAEGITSKYYVNTSSYSYPVFREANFICPEGSCTAVVSDVPFCSYALLRAIASPEELAEGQVYVGGHKIDPSDYLYIGSDRLISRHSSVLEWLVDNASGKAKEAEKKYNDLLSDIGISKWAKSSLSSLSYSRRILVLLLSSAAHKAKMILINDPHFAVEPKDEMIARRIFQQLHDSGKTVMISTPDLNTIQSIASRIVLLKNSMLQYNGSFKQFMEQYGGTAVSFPKEYMDEVKVAADSDPRFSLIETDDECILELQKGYTGSTGDAIRLAEEAGVPTEQIRNTEKTFSDACREALDT